jgi:cytochrome b involved in lipid metabolism
VYCGFIKKETYWRSFGVSNELIAQESGEVSKTTSVSTSNTVNVHFKCDSLLKAENSLTHDNSRTITKDELNEKGALILNEDGTANNLWIAINGYVYDLSSFSRKHPGGTSVLFRRAGTNSSDAFNKVGHSPSAHRMMEKYKIGRFESTIYSSPSFEEHKESEMLKHSYGPDNSTKGISTPSSYNIKQKVDKSRFTIDEWGFGSGILSVDGKYSVFKKYENNAEVYFPPFIGILLAIIFMSASSAVTKGMVPEDIPIYDVSQGSFYYKVIGVEISLSKIPMQSGMICLVIILIDCFAQFINQNRENRRTKSYCGLISDICLPLISFRFHVSALAFLITLFPDIFLLNLGSTSLSSQSIRVSLLLSYIVETVYRKVSECGLFTTITNCTILLLLGSFSIDFYNFCKVLLDYEVRTQIFILVYEITLYTKEFERKV